LHLYIPYIFSSLYDHYHSSHYIIPKRLSGTDLLYLQRLLQSNSYSIHIATMPPHSKLEILHAYRHLLRTSLRAIQYSTPARHVLLSRLRLSFRSSPLADFEPARIANTVTFLEGAAKTTGMEHQILRNLLKVWYWEPVQWRDRGGRDGGAVGRGASAGVGMGEKVVGEKMVKGGAYGGFYWNLRMLNESMGLCLR
jgi:hypothetical protein